jgi:hypothetical protein
VSKVKCKADSRNMNNVLQTYLINQQFLNLPVSELHYMLKITKTSKGLLFIWITSILEIKTETCKIFINSFKNNNVTTNDKFL